MSDKQVFEYARDDFNYPRFIERLLTKALNYAVTWIGNQQITAAQLNKFRYLMEGLAVLTLLFGAYLATAVLLAIWIFLDQAYLHSFVDRTVAASRFKHFIEEVPLLLALTIHMWLQGHWWTGVAALLGLSGLYFLTNLQMKYELGALNLPRLYFLRWDRLGIVFLFTLLGAWPGERAYLFVVLLAWFLAALTYYDYIWILIQLTKKKK